MEWDWKFRNLAAPLIAIFIGAGWLISPDLDTPIPPVLLAALVGLGVGRLVWLAIYGWPKSPPSN